jgi:monooxygenase
LDNTADQFGLHKYIRCRHRVRQTNFVADEAKWQLTVEVDGEQDPDEVLRAGDASQVPPKKKHVVQMSCQFLMLCSGYYRYSSGYAPAIPGLSSFTGPVVHPQLWPRDEQLELKDKRVIVIGSGATAVTLVPALAERGTKSVTMLQRSPSYMMSLPSVDPVWRLLSRFLPTYFVCHFLRIKHILFYVFTFWICRTFPTLVRRVMHGCLKCVLPTGFDMRHVTPLYKPWEQRFCLVPDGDLFRALRQGKADIVTDTIDSVIPSGIRLTSGQELPADIIVTATGLHMELGGGMAFCIDDKPVDLANSMMYRGMMLSGVPNLVVVMGYTNASVSSATNSMPSLPAISVAFWADSSLMLLLFESMCVAVDVEMRVGVSTLQRPVAPHGRDGLLLLCGASRRRRGAEALVGLLVGLCAARLQLVAETRKQGTVEATAKLRESNNRCCCDHRLRVSMLCVR